MNLSDALKARWYPKFIPNTPVTSFKIGGWRILVMNAGTIAGKPLLCQRVSDGKQQFLNFNDLENDYLAEPTYIRYAAHHGYKLDSRENNLLKFERLKS